MTHLAYTVNEACEAARISRNTLYRNIRAGHVRAVKCGSRTLIPREGFDTWFNSLDPLQSKKEI